MSKFNFKLLIFTIMLVLGIIILSSTVYASNEDVQILQNDSDEYLIYIKDYEEATFKFFAFSNDKNEEPDTYRTTATDSVGGKTVAYVDSNTKSLFSNPTYMWAKLDDGTYIMKAVEIDLSKAVKNTDLEEATKITNIIDADTTKTSTTEKEENGKKITTTIGEIELKDEKGDFSYIIINLPSSEEYNNLMKIATKISKFNSKTDMYTQIETYSEFLKLFNELKPNESDGWIKVEKNIIYQPENADDGNEYVVWIKDNKTKEIDVHFLTSTKEESEEIIKEALTTKLPVTYDNNTLLVVFGILVVLIIIVSIRIKCLNKKEN